MPCREWQQSGGGRASGHYPDNPHKVTKWESDTRTTVAPVEALRYLGTDFKWLLYGDDDVAMFWPGLLRALKDLDPEDPYYISDNYWVFWPKGVGGTLQPDQLRCIPCTLDTEATKCVWHQGYRYTDPGFELRNDKMFQFNMYNGDWPKVAKEAAEAVAGTGCDEKCRLRLDNVASCHTNGAQMQDFAGSGRSVHGMLRIMSEYTELTSPGGLNELVKGLKLPRV
ncbi:hypothetical protein C2E20_1936 [Micractinium conductrix]|uniref:Uncharacterized protein n=1 Tax=Micractinium conductrix TaxID=554055 RepID=A0A2P6VLL8_9CHLO|nr:hypothetical protein C2E20_1936 [Micractinium conductrix]|eukprot:PSC74974.1 hypothetical protein C2E20_1936 [Micractinium conductrix]